jgi:bacteriochlorophyllide a dehydrogenase
MTNSLAVVLARPQQIALASLALASPADDEVVVQVDYSGVSTGTERLLFDGRMPDFPGMGYPLVPGYESVGRIVDAGAQARQRIGEHVFVPGARCWGEVRGLFGGAAQRLVSPSSRVLQMADIGPPGVLMALAASAYHAVAGGGKRERITPPDLIVGHGVLGRLLARMTVTAGGPAPTVWETNPQRQSGGDGYAVLHPDADERRDYRSVYEVSGDASLLDRLITRLAPGGEIVLAGYYTQPLAFAFAPAFMREAQIRCAAEWQRADLLAVRELVQGGRLSLDGLVTHLDEPAHAEPAYRTAFDDASCLKMVLDWRHCQ